MNGDGTSGICNNDEPASNGERRMSVLKPRVMMTLVVVVMTMPAGNGERC